MRVTVEKMVKGAGVGLVRAGRRDQGGEDGGRDPHGDDGICGQEVFTQSATIQRSMVEL